MNQCNKQEIVMDGFNPDFFMKMILSLSVLFLLSCSSSPVWVEGKPKHHTNEGFRNYPIVPSSTSPGIRFYWRRIRSAFSLPTVPEDHYLSEEKAIDQFQKLKDKNTLTWIGQATFLIKIDGKNILTDPFFSEYAGPFSTRPRRFVEPGICIENLSLIDIIIISHNHYDHLDAEAVEALPGKENIHVFVPLGLKPFFVERGYIHVHELDWYENFSIDNLHTLSVNETIELDGMSITGIKATHELVTFKFGPFSKTSHPGPKERVGWGAIGFQIKLNGKTIVNLGDTLLHEKEWQKIKKPDVLMIPIGGRIIPNTMNEEEALQAVRIIKPNLVIPCHYSDPALFSKHFNPADDKMFKREFKNRSQMRNST